MTNAYDSTRGNVTDRQRRKAWLLETYAADMAIAIYTPASGQRYVLHISISAVEIYRADGCEIRKCCRCYRCGKLLMYETLTVDRIKPGCKGGTYRRDNIRPSCSDCANKTGGFLRAETRNSVPLVRPVVPDVAPCDTPARRRSTGAVSLPDVQASSPHDLRINGQVEGRS